MVHPSSAEVPSEAAAAGPLVLPRRPASGHKGTFGRVAIVAGSVGMTGAAVLAGRAALRGGAGLVTVFTPEACQSVVAAAEPSYMTVGLPDDAAGRLQSAALPTLLDRCALQQSVALGPGWGQSAELPQLVSTLLRELTVPIVIDADALNAVATLPSVYWHDRTRQAGRIVTPHPGEFSRLTGKTIDEIAADRCGVAAAYARDHQLVVVLKGAGTVVTDGVRTVVNPTGNSGMATGGSGDVLTGLMAGLLAQGLPAFDAARTAVYVHGLAGDLAAEAWSAPGLTATDLPDAIARAWKHLGL
jgi:ADP-dependent NAD(P)H-hydrate dehydratase